MKLNTLIGKGVTAEIYAYEDYAIKLFTNPLGKELAKREAKKQEIAHALRIPVPKVIQLTEISGKKAIVMERLDGETFGHLILQDRTKTPDYLERSIELQKQLHEITPVNIELMEEKLTKQIFEVTLLDKHIKNYIHRKMLSIIEHTSLCHFDFHLNNIIQTQDETYIIDWADATFGDFRADVCRTYLIYVEHAPTIASHYLNRYCEKRKIAKETILTWLPIIAGARLNENISPKEKNRLLHIVKEQYKNETK